MTVDNKASTALSSVTKARTLAANSYAKRTQLLTASGLIAGITPTSIRVALPQETLDSASSKQGGTAVEKRRRAF
jgi:hypothetical protein